MFGAWRIRMTIQQRAVHPRRIGVLTYLRDRNPGQYFQALATYQILTERFRGSTVEFVDLLHWRAGAIQRRDVLRSASSRLYMRYVLGYWRAWRGLRMSKGRCVTQDYAAAAAFLSAQAYDLIVVGSDVVLKVPPSRPVSRGSPPIYWIPPSVRGPKAMLASSSDVTRHESLTNEQRAMMSSSLRGFGCCLVRDEMTSTLLLELGASERLVSVIPDPTFALALPDEVARNSRRVFSERISVGTKPLLGLNLSSTPTEWKDELVRRLARGFDIICLREYPGLRYLGPVTPWEWAGIFPCFDLVLTYSFHETVFCLKYGVPVVSIAAVPAFVDSQSGRSKLSSLMSAFGLEKDCLITPDWNNTSSPEEMYEVVKRAQVAFMRDSAARRSEAFGRKYCDAVEMMRQLLLQDGSCEMSPSSAGATLPLSLRSIE
ncbi:MAG: polysaccharide pyruvyl transferase family protein [Verrucomicrobiia bacterium]